MTADVPLWAEWLVAVLLALSGVLILVSAVGFVRLPDFFLRMHPTALAYTCGSWCVTLASCVYFTMREGKLALHPCLIAIVLSITVPVTTVLIARAALFRRRVAATPDTPSAITRR